jgi:membrane peptidoglycan carboxypeptidase
MVAPALAMTGMTARNTIGVFESLPSYFALDKQHQRNEIVAISADDGSEIHIADYFDQNREEVALDQISQNLQDAAVDGEDRRFFEHGGVDIPSVFRAVLGQASGNEDSGGASTLSMQLVRNTLVLRAVNDLKLTDVEREAAIREAVFPDLNRKLNEMKLAISLEKKYSKQEILTAYLNIVGMGGTTYGVQAGATRFFSINAKDATPAQAASLIAIVQNPTHLSLDDPENYAANQARRDVILGFMYGEGHLTRAEYAEAIATPVDDTFVIPNPPANGCLAAPPEYRFPCDYAIESIRNGDVPILGATAEEQLAQLRAGGYKIVLTINPQLQITATQTVQYWAPKDETRFQLGAAATTVEVGTGRILIMAENKDFDNRDAKDVPYTATAVNFNADKYHGGSAGFQTGSSYKPYTLLAFLAAGHGLEESFDASKLQLNQAQFKDSCKGPWGGNFKFKNDSGERGPYTVLRATAGSVNSIFLQMATKVDQCDTANIARSLGVHRADGAPDGSDLGSQPSCVIGTCENNLAPVTQAAAFAAIANQGVFCKPIIIDHIYSPTGEDLGGQDADCGQSLVQPNVANTAVFAMQGVFKGGTASASNPRDGTPYMGKTGTTDNSVHVWLVGSSTRAATAVWIGNISGKQQLRKISIQGTQGALLRHRVFRPIALAIDAYYPGAAFPGPDNALLSGNRVFVPENLVGLTPEQVRSALEIADLSYQDAGPADSDLAAGLVAATSPGGGTQVPRGTPIAVYISNGQGATVPDVVSDNQSFGAAKNELQAAGFNNVSEACLAAQPADPPGTNDRVVAQSVSAGSVVNRNTDIVLGVRKPTCP